MLAFIAVVLIDAFYTVGFKNIALLLQSESFPTEIRSYASGAFGALTSLNVFGATSLFPYLTEYLGFFGTFWMFGGIMFMDSVYAIIIVPENRGDTLVTTEDKL